MSCESNEKPNMNEICREDSFLLRNQRCGMGDRKDIRPTGNVSSAGWQVTSCGDPVWHVSFRSGEACFELL